MKKITKNEFEKSCKIMKNRRRFHCNPDKDDRPFLIEKFFHEAIVLLLHEGYVEKEYYDIFPAEYDEKKIITEKMIFSVMNELLIDYYKNLK